MTLATWYWIMMLIWLIVGTLIWWPNYRWGLSSVMLFVVLIMLGWKVFGPPIKG